MLLFASICCSKYVMLQEHNQPPVHNPTRICLVTTKLIVPHRHSLGNFLFGEGTEEAINAFK